MEKHSLYKLGGSEYVIRLFNTFKDFDNLYFQMEYVPGGELWDERTILSLYNIFIYLLFLQ